MSAARPLRVLLIANDGFSAGHVARSVAIARGLGRAAVRRGIALSAVLATTSQAHALFAREPLAIVTLPAPAAARHAGLSDAERRRLVRTALDGVIEGLGPDLIVVDTFPSGPHGELAGLARRDRRARRALVRRSVPEVRDEALLAGLGDHDLAVVAGDPSPPALELPIATLRVPPITLVEARDLLERDAARAALGLPAGRAILVAAGGGGDRDASDRACAIAEAILRVAPGVAPVLAVGPLAPEGVVSGARIQAIRLAPIAPMLAAFDGAFAAAGYNSSHELARARVPAALFAQPRPFDDQAARARRFAAAGFARVLDDVTDDAIAAALAWMATARLPELEAGGADRAADGLLDLVMGARG